MKNVTEDRLAKRYFLARSLLKLIKKKKEYMMISMANNRGIPDGENGKDKNCKGRGISRQLGFGTDVDICVGGEFKWK